MLPGERRAEHLPSRLPDPDYGGRVTILTAAARDNDEVLGSGWAPA